MKDVLAVESGKQLLSNEELSSLKGDVTVTVASILTRDASGKVSVEDATTHKVNNPATFTAENKVVLDSTSHEYNNAGNWVGLLYAVQALASVIWALMLPRFKSRKFSYSLSLALGAIGFVTLGIFDNQYLLFISFILIGCAWSAMLAWPFTILTNSLKSGNIGAYLGLFNCTICIPQIVAALLGGVILSIFSTPGKLAPEYIMMVVAGVAIFIGAICVFFIKEGAPEDDKMKVQETPAISETL
ncbi:MAG: MFS transporter [Muribaculaceae bacterium]|nr:MFS transporter [Muribaculaceae bacterium]